MRLINGICSLLFGILKLVFMVVLVIVSFGIAWGIKK